MGIQYEYRGKKTNGSFCISPLLDTFEDAYEQASILVSEGYDEIVIVFHIHGFVTPIDYFSLTKPENYRP